MSAFRRTVAPVIVAAVVFLDIVAAVPASADARSIDRGKDFARANCSRCHSIGRFSRSPLKSAPPFRTLHRHYPVETLEDALAEGISTGHPRMPEFRLEPGQVGDFISFLKS